MHVIPRSWQFDGNLDAPTVAPSVKITGKQAVHDGKALDYCCHYILTAGVLNFGTDCTHRLAGQRVPLPMLPAAMKNAG